MDPRAARAFRAGKALAIVAAITYGVLPAIIDTFDPHHLLNPDWPPHARLHLMWLNSVGLYLSLFGILQFWRATPATFERVQIGALTGAMHIAGFFTAAVFKEAAGAAFDADGRVLLGFFPPAALHLSTSALLLLAGYALCRRAALTTVK